MSTVAPRVPDTLDEMLSPVWLAGILSKQYPGIRVNGVTRGPVIARVATNARFEVDCDGLGEDKAPLALCVKGFFTESGTLVPGTGEHEAYFYRDLADSTGVRTLSAVYADVHPEHGAGLVITRDIVAEGSVFLDALAPYTPDQAAVSLSQLARLHASTWGVPALADVGWLAPRLDGHLKHRGFKEINGNFTGPIGAGVPAEVRDAQRLVDAYRRFAAMVAAASPWCVVHGDPHVGNVYLDPEGRPSFVDWQLAQRGPWWVDVGYHIASALTVEDRRGHERDLLRHYLDELRAGGVDAPPLDDAWTGFRRGIIEGFYLWGITLKVKPEITNVLLTRIGTAVADHDSLTAVLVDEG
ncbi:MULTISPECIES: phosphotransferase [unclassified Pseudofrankia]|uniref:phosphotransferase n=1 Tax=unclassified Pseudofrankia TaxID=2994372 RepID=UPI0008DA86A2|nr:MULTISPECIES: phosphotransferase [unclassified Pseudofrankia]MDT3439100.1 phosphotransferase [Pseudofrankia sp. BMG5.37]OHV45765.1 aminoglycoside phosphotransferase [Pseudofrankia sp. BMG5.36]